MPRLYVEIKGFLWWVFFCFCVGGHFILVDICLLAVGESLLAVENNQKSKKVKSQKSNICGQREFLLGQREFLLGQRESQKSKKNQTSTWGKNYGTNTLKNHIKFNIAIITSKSYVIKERKTMMLKLFLKNVSPSLPAMSAMTEESLRSMFSKAASRDDNKNDDNDKRRLD